MTRTAQPVVAYPPPSRTDGLSTADLVSRAAKEAARLVRDELQLAQAEITQKGKRAGLGAGLFGAAGALTFYGGACFVAAAILALSVVVSAWFAAAVAGIAVMAVAGLLALAGRRAVRQLTPVLPTETIEGLRADLQTVLARAKREAGK